MSTFSPLIAMAAHPRSKANPDFAFPPKRSLFLSFGVPWSSLLSAEDLVSQSLELEEEVPLWPSESCNLEMAGLTVGWKFGGRLNRGFPSLVAPLEDIEELLLDKLVFPTLAAANRRRSFGISKGKSLKGTSSFLLLCSPYSMLMPLSEPCTSPSLGGPGRM